MDFPFETTTKNGQKATVLGTMPDGRLLGFIMREDGTFTPWSWNAGGSCYHPEHASITLPLRIKPLTAYRMRGGGVAWTSGMTSRGWIHGLIGDKTNRTWRISDGRWNAEQEHDLDLVEELPPPTE